MYKEDAIKYIFYSLKIAIEQISFNFVRRAIKNNKIKLLLASTQYFSTNAIIVSERQCKIISDFNTF